MKNLCICYYGHCRSVAMARFLHNKGLPAVAAGVGTSGNVIKILSEWADNIYVMQAGYALAVPEEHRAKVVLIDVGPDKWSNPYNLDLAALIERLYNEQVERRAGA